MFSKATKDFVRQVGEEGSLIHVSTMNDSYKVVPLGLVIKCKPIRFWKKPKYRPTDFTLSDLLLGDTIITPLLTVKDFVAYKGTIGDKYKGRVRTEGGPVNVDVGRTGTYKLTSSFGQLKIEHLNVKKLRADSSDRLLDMQHDLVEQLEKRASVLTVVKERIFTTTSCSVTQSTNVSCTFQGVFNLLGGPARPVEVSASDDPRAEQDNDTSIDISPGTPIGYSVLELEIKKDGHYSICLQHDTTGGFEEDSILPSSTSSESLDFVDSLLNRCRIQGNVSVSTLLNGSDDVDLSALADLPLSTRCAFREKLHQTLNDRSTLTYLQCALEDLCNGEKLNMTDLSESQRKLVSEILDTLSSETRTENGHCEIPAHLNAAHLLVSAIEELPDETLSLLSESSPCFLEAFDKLMCRLKEDSEPFSNLPVFLKDNQYFQMAEQLLGSVGVTLKKDVDKLWTETDSHAGVLPLVLFLSTHGLASLYSGSN